MGKHPLIAIVISIAASVLACAAGTDDSVPGAPTKADSGTSKETGGTDDAAPPEDGDPPPPDETGTPPDDETGAPPEDTGTSPPPPPSDGGALPSDGIWAADKPYYNSPEELCDYVNSQRKWDNGHERYKGFPWKGTYHSDRTWPVTFTVDPALNALAQAEANRLAKSGGPKGMSTSDSSWRKPVWFDGIDTAAEMATSKDEPGDWDPTKSFASKVGFIGTNGSCRQGMFYHDPGPGGPKLNKMGCGGALSADGKAKWWVVMLRP